MGGTAAPAAGIRGSEVSDPEDANWDDYESGPYCQHWREPWDCVEVCGRCGHPCDRHMGECREPGCTCDGFTDPPNVG